MYAILIIIFLLFFLLCMIIVMINKIMKYVAFIAEITAFNKTAIMYCLTCLRTYMINAMNKASDEENYDDAQALKDIIMDIDKTYSKEKK